jgi:1-acyl-sn-glycerol-3-phosphate acyltransferase
LQTVKNAQDFQKVITLPAIQGIVSKTSDGLTSSGFENLSKDEHYVFVGNHRDITLDSSLLGMLQLYHGFATSQITWGNNLMVSELIVDLGKCNQMITVFREGSPKEMLINSQNLSAYIRQAVVDENKTVWIAQRKGRAKNGFDLTDVSILKMLSLSRKADVKSGLAELNIVPVTVSYELEPCGGMKVREIYLSQFENYVKDKDEDFKSIIGGATIPKGRIHYSIGKPINADLLNLDDTLNKNEIVDEVAKIIDRQMYQNYHLWPTNYLAYDLLEQSERFAEHYDDKTRAQLNERLAMACEAVEADSGEIKKLFYQMYANPVYNKLKTESK